MFRFNDLVNSGFLAWSDYVRILLAVVIMCRFAAVLHVLLYRSIDTNVLFTAVGCQMSEFEPSLACFFSIFSDFCFLSFFFWVGEWVHGRT